MTGARSSHDGTPPGHGLRVLYVEDDPDVQEMLKTLLEDHGYAVTTASTAEDGLEALRHDRFHLVIADYNLPDGDGASMLVKAAREGRLHCESLILTGAFRLGTHATAFRVLRKPIDAMAFLAKLDEILAPARDAEMAHARAHIEATSSRNPRVATEKRIELVLYVSEASRASLRAVRRLEDLLTAYDPRKVCLRIVDVSREQPESFDDDRITFTPMLVKHHPSPKAYFLGALDRVEDVKELLGEIADTGGPADDSQAVDGRPRT